MENDLDILTSVYQCIDLAVFIVNIDQNGVFRYAGLNPAHEKLTGLNSTAIKGKTPDELYPQISKNAIKEIKKKYDACYKKAKTIKYEEHFPIDDQEFWWLTKLTPIKNKGGRIYRIIGTSVEITDLKNTELELLENKKQNEELRSLNENIEKEVGSRTLVLRERIKELRCIIDVAKLANQIKMSADKLALELVKIIPDAWQYPGITVCKINLNGTNYKSENFKKTKNLLQAPLHLDKKKIGSIEVYYTKEMPALDEGPFLKEERNLIDAMANILENFLEREKNLIEIKKKNREYQSLAEEYQSKNEELSKVNSKLEKEIDKRKKQEQLLEENLTKYNEVFNLQHNCVAIYDVQNNGTEFFFAEFNQAAENIEKIKRKDVIGKNILEVFPGAKEFGIVEVFKRVFKTGKAEYFPVTFYEDERISGWRDNYIYRISTNQIIAVYQDVTDKKIAELNLKESEAFLLESQKLFKSVFENSSLGKSLTGVDGSLMVNKAFCKMLGYTEKEIQNKHWKEFTHEDDVQQNMDIVNSLLAGKKSAFRFEKRYIHKNGKIIYTDVHTTLLKDENNEAKFFITAISDITKKKELEQKIAKYNVELESEVAERTRELLHKNKELENFAYSVSHDLHAPLRAIIGYSNILKEEYSNKLNEDGSDIIDVISRNASKMSRLINDILEFSRLGRKEIKKQKIDMNVLFNDVYNELILNIDSKNINFNIENDLPIIQGDYSMIEILVTNLLSNAIKFSLNTQKPKITIKSKVETGFYRVSIADNGVGFNPKYKDKLFDVFQRLHSEKEFPGTGAGLSIAQRIVQKHGGKIWAQSQLGKGATFHFTIAKNL